MEVRQRRCGARQSERCLVRCRRVSIFTTYYMTNMLVQYQRYTHDPKSNKKQQRPVESICAVLFELH